MITGGMSVPVPSLDEVSNLLGGDELLVIDRCGEELAVSQRTGRERNIIFASKGYHLPAIRIVFTTHGDYPFPLMEIISVTRGDHPSDPWRLSPSIKGMIPLRPACLIRHCFLFAMAKLHISVAAAVLFCAVRYTSKFFCLEKAVFHGSQRYSTISSISRRV